MLMTGICGLSLSLAAQAQPRTPVYPPPGHVLLDDMWVPRTALLGDSHWDGPTWTGGIVPYTFDSATVSYGEQVAMKLAFAEIEAVCGVRFVPWTSGVQHIQIRENPAQSNVSNSQVGMQQFGQILNVGASHWDDHFILVHELLHALGFKHEHQRPDRNLYVSILWNNIEQFGCGGGSCNGNFSVFNGQPIGPYDFESVMHYHRKSFGIGNHDTIRCRPGFEQHQNVIGNLSYLSYYDVQGLQTKYGIPTGPSITSHVPTTVITGSGAIDVHVTGAGFFVGSFEPYKGTQGSKLQYLQNGAWVTMPTTVTSKTKLIGSMDVGSNFPVGQLNFRVLNDVLAGGASNVVSTTVTAPPCNSASEWTGHAVVALPDIDGDGYEESLIGRPGFNGGRGQVYCRSGADGSALWTFSGTTINGNIGYALARIGDLNGDSIPEVASGAPGQGNGAVHVLDCTTGTVLRFIDGGSFGSGPGFGRAVGAAGDLDNDGNPDLVVGSPDHASNRGRIDLLSGATGGLFFGIPGLQTGERFGDSVGGGVDLNGDGRPEVVAGAPLFDGSAGVRCGRVAIYEGAFGTALVGAQGDGPYDYFGRAVAIVPSIDGKKVGNVAVGAPENGSHGGNVGNGYVRVFRYLTGPLVGLHSVTTWTGTFYGGRFGFRVVGAGDANDDGGTDFLIAGPGTAAATARLELRSGRDGGLLWFTQRSPSSDGFGWGIDIGDTNGDGTPDALIGSPYSDGQCVDSGSFTSASIPVSPAAEKLMITEVVSAIPPTVPGAVELTNFSSVPIDLTDWRVRWRDIFPIGHTGGNSMALAGVVIQPQETIVLRTQLATQGFAEIPLSVRVFPVLTGASTAATDFCVGLVAPNGYVIDEVRSAAVGGGYYEGSLGGKFRGAVHNHQSGPFFTSRRIERIWGLDSNSATDWTADYGRSLGLESQSAGARNVRAALFTTARVQLNEVFRGGATYVELLSRDQSPVNLQGWTLRYSAAQGAPIQTLQPFPDTEVLTTGELLVIGNTAQPPAETPTGVSYRRSNDLTLGAAEFSIGLYDAAGRLVDLLRATRANSPVEHNDPRLPSHPDDFRTAALAPDISQSLARNADGLDHDVGHDWRPFPIRSMGSPNLQPFTPSTTGDVDVRVNDGPGGAMTIVLDAGADRAGQQWGLRAYLGHSVNQVGTKTLLLDSFGGGSPFVGVLGNRGEGRLDFDATAVPPGLELDIQFVIMDPVENVMTTTTGTLMFDS